MLPWPSFAAHEEAWQVNTSTDDDIDEFIARVIVAKENLSVEDLVLVQNQLDELLGALGHGHGARDADAAGLLRLGHEQTR